MTPPLTGLIVDLLGFLTGTVLYAMLVVMVWRDRAASGQTPSMRRGLLPLATGCCGLLWNVGALVSFGPRVASAGVPIPAVVAVAFGALGFLPGGISGDDAHALLVLPRPRVGAAGDPPARLARRQLPHRHRPDLCRAADPVRILVAGQEQG